MAGKLEEVEGFQQIGKGVAEVPSQGNCWIYQRIYRPEWYEGGYVAKIKESHQKDRNDSAIALTHKDCSGNVLGKVRVGNYWRFIEAGSQSSSGWNFRVSQEKSGYCLSIIHNYVEFSCRTEKIPNIPYNIQINDAKKGTVQSHVKVKIYGYSTCPAI